MINHARTLLLNISPDRADYLDANLEGYEYIPDEFSPVRLPDRINTLRRVLFGNNPDALYAGLRVQELMTYIHQSEFADYATAFDSRVTYWPQMVEKKQNAYAKTVLLSQVTGDPRRLVVSGEVAAGDVRGRAYRSYVVAIGKQNENDTELSLIARWLEPPFTQNTVPFAVGSVQPVTLPDTGLAALPSDTNLQTDISFLTTQSGGKLITESYSAEQPVFLETAGTAFRPELYDELARWYVVVRTAPLPIASALMPTLKKLGEPVYLELFGAAPKEPMLTFKNLWEQHPSAFYNLVGLGLGLIYRTEEVRNA